MKTKIFQGIKYIFACLYMVYAISPLMADVGTAPRNGLAAGRDEPVIKILLLEKFFTVLQSPGEESEPGDSDTGDDLLVKKIRCLPRGNSFLKQIYADSRASEADLFGVEDFISSRQDVFLPTPITTTTNVPEPSAGFGTLHSGLAPPSLFA